MQKRIPQAFGDLFVFAGKIAAGVKACHDTLPLFMHGETEIRAGMDSLWANMKAHSDAKIEMESRRKTLDESIKTMRAFLTLARDTWKPRLGTSHNRAWEHVGLRGSLMIPREIADLEWVAQRFVDRLEDSPDFALPQLEITAAKARELRARLSTDHAAVVQHKSTLGRCKNERDASAKALTIILRETIGELNLRLPPMSTRWVLFSLNIPGIKKAPEVPENVTVTEVSDTVSVVKWEQAPRAEHYRVWEKSSTGEMTPLETRHSCDITIERSPDAPRELAVSTVNHRGESLRSATIVIPQKVSNVESNASRPPTSQGALEQSTLQTPGKPLHG